MGYLNKATITVDAILTNRGRELLAQGGTSETGFNITKFAVADDEIDYTLYDVTHPNGSEYYGNVIENMPLLEATPDESQIMRYKLVTLDSTTFGNAFVGTDGSITIPKITNFGADNNTITVGGTNDTKPEYTPATNPQFAENYTVLVSNARIIKIEEKEGTTYTQLNTADTINANGSITVNVSGSNSIRFTKVKAGNTSATIFGNSTGASRTVSISVT